MEMTEAQMMLVKKTWAMFRNIDPVIVGDVFYSRLFFQEPSLEKMFKSSMTEQYQKLIDMLSTIVARLERMDEISYDIQQLAIRHIKYGVKPAHYEMVGNALLWTLEQGLGNDWNEEVKEAWVKCYTSISSSMIAATVAEK
jgi:nitric oxide dioxygenase